MRLVCMDHDHSCPRIAGQDQRSRLELGSRFEKRSVGPRSSIEDSFFSLVIILFLLDFIFSSINGTKWQHYGVRCAQAGSMIFQSTTFTSSFSFS